MSYPIYLNITTPTPINFVVNPIGARGLSAYIVALINGYEGTEGEWLVSLKGSKGEQGIKGDTGSYATVTGTSPVVVTSGVVSIPKSTNSVDGFLAKEDWTTFNGKQPAGSYVTSGGALGTPASGNLANCTFPTLNQNTAGTATSATTATNVSGGTVSATTGSFSGIMSPIGIGIAPGTPKLTIASSSNAQASMIEVKDTNGGGTYTAFKLESDQNGSGIWSQYILGARKFYFSPWFGSPSYILVNMGFGTTNAGAVVDIKGAGTTTGLALRTQDSGGNDKFSVIDAGHVKISSMTTTVRDSVTASNGMICYNTTTNKFQGYEGGAWVNLI